MPIKNNPLLVEDELRAVENRIRVARKETRPGRYLGLDTLPLEYFPETATYNPVGNLVQDTRRMSPDARNWR